MPVEFTNVPITDGSDEREGLPLLRGETDREVLLEVVCDEEPDADLVLRTLTDTDTEIEYDADDDVEVDCSVVLDDDIVDDSDCDEDSDLERVRDCDSAGVALSDVENVTVTVHVLERDEVKLIVAGGVDDLDTAADIDSDDDNVGELVDDVDAETDVDSDAEEEAVGCCTCGDVDGDCVRDGDEEQAGAVKSIGHVNASRTM